MKHRPRKAERGVMVRMGYVERVRQGLHAFAQGTAVEVLVEHQTGCPATSGSSCTCIPDITATLSDGRRITIDAEGRATTPAVLS